MRYTIDAKNITSSIYPCPYEYKGTNPQGETIDFTNYYMQKDGQPYFAASGEMHFSRIDPMFWEDEIIKMKMAGITMISTYLFWIHHEEVKGQFDWTGSNDLRAFLSLCNKQKIYVLLRVGPFSHGECRNGGFPDWMFGAPYDVRSNAPEYLFYVERYFQEIGRQAGGFMFKDGGPVVSIQLENEYEHASSPWEPTTENSGEWTASGNDGPSHFKVLKELAVKAGLIAPLYSTTAWGGACAPVEYVMPLWGGYAFWPWIFYGDDVKEHPATTEFLYKDFHNNNAPKYYNFDPEYPPEDLPFICCEMGGGMANYYRYRFQLPFESVEALANVKAASGCNFLGYYMFHGGSHPKGKRVAYLNECALPKISYDYQAAVGEYGQLRPSYHRVKLLHYFYKDFEKEFCRTKTVLSRESIEMKQQDVDTLRYCVRVEQGKGFLFLNNYQDHVQTKAQEHLSVAVTLDNEILQIPAKGKMSLAKDACAVLPMRMGLEGAHLISATVQPITKLVNQGRTVYFFFMPEGMAPQLLLDGRTVKAIGGGCQVEELDGNKLVELPGTQTSSFQVTDTHGKTFEVCVLSRADSLRFWRVKRPEGDLAFLCSETILDDVDGLRVESIGQTSGEIAVFPPRPNLTVAGRTYASAKNDGLFASFHVEYGRYSPTMTWEDASSREKAGDGALKRPVIGSPITSTKVVNARARLSFTPGDFEGVKQVLVRVSYDGDIGYAFTGEELVNDNFSNGAPWEFGLKAYEKQVLAQGIHIYVSPRRKGGKVNCTSEMAARYASYESSFAKIHDIQMVPVFDCPVTF